ncbi:MAG: hypothetical protein AAF493_11995 [Pseudomonadota bacterium]
MSFGGGASAAYRLTVSMVSVALVTMVMMGADMWGVRIVSEFESCTIGHRIGGERGKYQKEE